MGLGVELVAALPAAVAGGDIAELDMTGGVPPDAEVGGEAVGAKEFAVVLSRHLEDVAGIEKGSERR